MHSAPCSNLYIVHIEGTPIIPLTYIRVTAVVWEYDDGQTDRQTDIHTQMCVTNIHFASVSLTRNVTSIYGTCYEFER